MARRRAAMRTTSHPGTGVSSLPAVTTAVIFTALVLLAGCGGGQTIPPTDPPVAPGPTATATTSATKARPTAEAPTGTPTQLPSVTGISAQETSASPGQSIFQANCSVCHGTGGEGQPNWHIKNPDGVLPAPPLNGDGHTWHHGDGTLYTYVSRGGKFFESPDIPSFKSGMPAFGEVLSRGEIIAVLEYVKCLWGDKVAEGLGLEKRKSQAEVSETNPYPEQ